VFGDMGSLLGEWTMGALINNSLYGTFDWVYHVGDISYADDFAEYFPEMYDEIWDEFFAGIEPVSAVRPYMVCPGNHEYSCENPECTNYTINFAAYNSRFLMPGAESFSNNTMWFSFNYLNAHFISISSETDFPYSPYNSTFGDQLKWLENDLINANNNRNATPWIIVVGHRPLYCSNEWFSSNGVPVEASYYFQQSFEQLFYKYHVDIYFCGHAHSYERIYPTYNNTPTSNNYVNPTSTTYIVAGAAGNIEGFLDTGWYKTSWSAYQDYTNFGFGILSILNNTHLNWKYFTSSGDFIKDEFNLIKN